MSEHSFRWDLPLDFDENESECEVRFSFHPGNGRTPRGPHDPDYDPPVVEDVQVWQERSEGWTDITGWLTDHMGDFEEACWDHLPDFEEERAAAADAKADAIADVRAEQQWMMRHSL